jgi:hypothetical protein
MTKPDSMEFEQELTEKIASGHEADLIQKTLLDQFEKRRNHIERQVFLRIESEEPLSGKKAVQAWLELHAVYRLEQHLLKRIKVGDAASQRLADHLRGDVGEEMRPDRQRFPHA